jgi:hypothetical protein
MAIQLNKEEFEVLKDDDKEIHLFDKVVNKLYVHDKAKNLWVFPQGSRSEIVKKLTGVDFNG